VATQTIAVLIVEDREPFMQLMAWALEQDGFTVRTCALAELTATAQSIQPSAVVFNMRHAKDEKRVRIERLRETAPGVCVVDVYERNQPDVGADGYIVAPVIASDLSTMIRDLCDKKLGA